MSREASPELRQLVELANALRLERYPGWALRIQQAATGRLGSGVVRQLLRRAQAIAAEAKRRPLLLPNPPTLEEYSAAARTDIAFATAVETPGLAVGLNLNDAAHLLVAGSTGSGKTTLLRQLIRAVHAWNSDHPDEQIHLLIFDRKAGDYADLGDHLGREHVLHLSAEHGLRLGLQPPRGVGARKWINVLAAMIAARAGLAYGQVTLMNVIAFLVEALKATSPADTQLWPSIPLVLEVLCAQKDTAFSAKADYTRSVVQALQGVASSGELWNCFRGLDVREDAFNAGKHCVIDMANLRPEWLRQLVADLLVQQLLMGAMERYERTDQLNTLIIIDEADDDVSARAEEAYAPNMMAVTEAFRKGREFGLGIVLGLSALQSASALIAGNAAYQIVMKLIDAAPIERARDTLDLHHGAEQIIPTLAKGECLFRSSQWPHAFLAQVEPLPANRARPAGYDAHPFIADRPLGALPAVKAALLAAFAAPPAKHVAEKKAPPPAKAAAEPTPLSPLAFQLLTIHSLSPWWPLHKALEKHDIDLSPAPLAKARQELAARKLAEFATPRFGKLNCTLMAATEAGEALLHRKRPKHAGRGGLVHRHMSHWIRMAGEQRGHLAHCELTLPGTTHAVDAAWETADGLEVFEVVVAEHKNLADHLTASFAAGTGVVQLTIVATQKRERERLERWVAARPELAAYADRVRYAEVVTFMQELWP